MAAEFVIVGRRDLPERSRPWDLDFENEQGGVSVYEASARYDPHGLEELHKSIEAIVGFRPLAILIVRKAWDLAQVVAEELATAVEGAVFCDVDDVVFFDAAGRGEPARSLQDLEERLKRAFENPQPFFERWQKKERAHFDAEEKRDPASAAARDWSDGK